MKRTADDYIAKIKEVEIKWEDAEWDLDDQQVASKPDDRFDGAYFDARSMLIDVLEELNAQGKMDFWLIKHPQIQKFWAHYQERKRIQKVHADALERLRTQFTKEELDTLRIRLPNGV